MEDYSTRTVDGARAHAAQFAEPEPVELLDAGDFPPGWEGEPDAPEEGAP